MLGVEEKEIFIIQNDGSFTLIQLKIIAIIQAN